MYPWCYSDGEDRALYRLWRCISVTCSWTVGILIQSSPTWVLLVVALGILPSTSMSTVGWTAMEHSPTGVSCSTIFTDGGPCVLQTSGCSSMTCSLRNLSLPVQTIDYNAIQSQPHPLACPLPACTKKRNLLLGGAGWS